MASRVTGDKFEIKAYVTENCYREMERLRSPKMPKSRFLATVLEEIFTPEPNTVNN